MEGKKKKIGASYWSPELWWLQETDQCLYIKKITSLNALSTALQR